MKNFISKFESKNSAQGFTVLEFIFVITLLGITSSVAIPIFKNGINKTKQKEASLIVSSMIKSAKANYGFSANLPNNMGDLSKFADFEKCNERGVETQGELVCKNKKPIKVARDDITFFSPSGNYKVDLKMGEINNEGQMFMVKANPNGNNFSKEGSAVVGCYSPISGITIIKEFTSRKFDKGEKPFVTCGETKIARGPPIPPLKIPGCTDPEALNYNPKATVDDGSCKYPEDPIPGCTDPEALNYNPKATVDDDSCKYNDSSEKVKISTKSNTNDLQNLDDSENIENRIQTEDKNSNNLSIKNQTKIIRNSNNLDLKDEFPQKSTLEKSRKGKKIEDIESPVPPWIR